METGTVGKVYIDDVCFTNAAARVGFEISDRGTFEIQKNKLGQDYIFSKFLFLYVVLTGCNSGFRY